jgi:hypothetical protein
MKYITVINKAKSPVRFFTTSTQRAIELSIATGHVRKAENAKVVHERDVCTDCFPHEGAAACRLAPTRIWIAANRENGVQEQLSGELHYTEECSELFRTVRTNVELDYGEFTATGFAPRN